ncbi:Membrane protein involved in the export of O-antigen and teichoic acid [Marinobacter sp. es.048]|uniref:oligosaccharide flippase family protein n=1 Tax=Marinobacter sp. es.048 TaxID=1761795 RepID=UPI000B58DFBE|nr:oligosaccharide flippase family protein [Marinobacter sp. es.048]SNC74362.1 Membrane protein involved in the export of O-antigen and teichoic acid [Marinobacter sp. es.048]
MLQRVLINTGSNVAQLMVSMVATFIMAPIYLKMMGHHDYGLREMVLALVGYMGMLDLGMRPTVSRFASMHNAQNDRESLLTVYGTSLVFMTLVGVILGLFFWLWALSFPDILNPEGMEGNTKYTLFLLLVGAQLVFLFPGFVCESFLEGLQRYYFKNLVNIFSIVLISVLAYHYITPENALALLALLAAVGTLIKLIIFAAILMRPMVGAIYPNLRLFSREKFREMLAFGFKSFIQGAAGKVEKMSDRIVIGTIMSPAMIPVYTIPATLVTYMATISMTLSHTFMPLFSDLDARGEREKSKIVYLLASKLLVALVIPMGVGICLVGGPFIAIWMSGQFDPDLVDAILILLVIYMGVPKLNPFASRYLTAINKHVIFAKVAPPAALVNLGLSIWLVLEYGVIGAALGSVLPVFVVMPIFLKVVADNLGITMLQYVKHAILPAIIPVMVMGGGLAWWRVEYGLAGYLDIVAAVVASGVVYGVLYWFISIGKDERDVLMRLMPARFRQGV